MKTKELEKFLGLVFVLIVQVLLVFFCKSLETILAITFFVLCCVDQQCLRSDLGLTQLQQFVHVCVDRSNSLLKSTQNSTGRLRSEYNTTM